MSTALASPDSTAPLISPAASCDAADDVIANDTRGVVLAHHEFERNGRTHGYPPVGGQAGV